MSYKDYCLNLSYCTLVCGYDLVDDVLVSVFGKHIRDMEPTQRYEIIRLLKENGADCGTHVNAEMQVHGKINTRRCDAGRR